MIRNVHVHLGIGRSCNERSQIQGILVGCQHSTDAVNEVMYVPLPERQERHLL